MNGIFDLAGGYTRNCAAGEEHWRSIAGSTSTIRRATPGSPGVDDRAAVGMSGAVLGNRLHVVGGYEGLVEFPTELPTLEVYDPGMNRSMKRASLADGHAGGAAAMSMKAGVHNRVRGRWGIGGVRVHALEAGASVTGCPQQGQAGNECRAS